MDSEGNCDTLTHGCIWRNDIPALGSDQVNSASGLQVSLRFRPAEMPKKRSLLDLFSSDFRSYR